MTDLTMHEPAVADDGASTGGRLEIRPMRYEDKREVCDRLSQTFTATPRADWEAVFEYAWLDEKPDYGLVAERDGQIVACGCILHSHRMIEGRRYDFAHGLAWWVSPESRGLMIGRRLIEEYFARYADCTLTFLTTRHDHKRFWKRYPLVPFEDRRIHVPPSPRALVAPRVREVPAAEVTPVMVGAEPYRIFRDHLPLRCAAQVFTDGSSHCVVISRRRTTDVPLPGWVEALRRRSPALERWLAPRAGEQGSARTIGWLRELVAHRWPLAEVMYVSDRPTARRWMGDLAALLARRHRALGLLVEERRFGLEPAGRRYIPGHYYYVSKDLPVEHADALYSEIVVLPM